VQSEITNHPGPAHEDRKQKTKDTDNGGWSSLKMVLLLLFLCSEIRFKVERDQAQGAAS